MTVTAERRRAARALGDLAAGFATVPADLSVGDVTLDSRAVTPGALFLACRGRTHHGVRFAPEAVARGARAVFYEAGLAADESLPQLPAGTFVAEVPALTERAGVIADRFFGAPSQALTVAGITGTNGKTTCAWLLAQALAGCRRRRPTSARSVSGCRRRLPRPCTRPQTLSRCSASWRACATRAPRACAWKSLPTLSTRRA